MAWIKYDPWQIEFLKTKGDKILCCGRQVGKTEICGADAAEYAISNPNTKPIVMIAPLEKQAFALFSKTLAYLQEHYPNKICKGKDRPTQSRIKLTSGVEIFCLPVGNQGLNIRFLTIGRLYIDEASRVDPIVFDSISPALLTTGGAQIWLSTLNGAQGNFYDCWINKDGAFDSFTRFAANTEEVIENREICSTWTQYQKESAKKVLDQAKKRMSQAMYAQEYLGMAMENLKRVFPDALISKICTLKRRSGISKGKKYYLGSDISALGDDETTIEVLEKINDDYIEHVENIVNKRVYTTETSEKIINMHKLYKLRKIGIDDQGVGFGVFSELLRDSKTRGITISLNNASRPLDELGEKSKRLLKEDMYMLLLAYMEQNKIRLLDDEMVKASLQSIIYELDQKPGEATKTRIYGTYSHICEGIIRALWLAVEDKSLSLWVR